MQIASIRPVRFSFLFALLATAAVFLLASCDTAGPEVPEDNGLRMIPATDGAGLLSLPNEGGLPAGGDAPQPGATTNSSNGLKKGFPKGASPYGCLISTLDPDGKPYAYRYEQVYVHFPKGVVKQAGGESKIALFVFGTKTLYAGGKVRDEAVVGRLMRCRIPKAKAADKLLHKQLRRFRRRGPNELETNEKAALASEVIAELTGGDQTAPGAAALNGAGSGASPAGGAATQGEWKCVEWAYPLVCGPNKDYTGETCYLKEPTCTRHEYVQTDDGSGGVPMTAAMTATVGVAAVAVAGRTRSSARTAPASFTKTE